MIKYKLGQRVRLVRDGVYYKSGARGVVIKPKNESMWEEGYYDVRMDNHHPLDLPGFFSPSSLTHEAIAKPTIIII